MRTISLVAVLVIATAVVAVPVSKTRMQHRLAAKDPPPAPPVLSSSFHAKYKIYGLDFHFKWLPHISNWFNQISHIIDGEAWQNIDGQGHVSIKTVTTPVGAGNLITGAMTQWWVPNHGWTLKGGHCTKDAVNTQLVIPGDVLVKGGKYIGVQDIYLIHPDPRPPTPNTGGRYRVDRWDATLPNGEGTVTYYLLHGTTTPIISHYMLKGKPPVYAQYDFVNPGVNPPEVYLAPRECTAAATF